MGMGSVFGNMVEAFENNATAREKKILQEAKSPVGMYTGNSQDEVINKETNTTIATNDFDLDVKEKTEARVTEDSALLDAIAKNEGTLKSGYSTTDGYDKYGKPEKPLEEMTINEVMKHQDKMLANQQGNSLKSSAVGRYQFLKQTIKDEVKAGGIDKNTMFTAALQDELILQRLKRMRGLDDWKSGELDTTEFKHNLSKEFASVKSPKTGRGYYPGQGAKDLLIKGFSR